MHVKIDIKDRALNRAILNKRTDKFYLIQIPCPMKLENLRKRMLLSGTDDV